MAQTAEVRRTYARYTRRILRVEWPVMTSDPTKPRHRFQFSLRTLLITVTLLAIPCGYVGWQAAIVRARAETIESLGTDKYLGFGNELFSGQWELRLDNSRLPLIRRILGDQFVSLAGYSGDIPSEQLKRVMAAFPEARII